MDDENAHGRAGILLIRHRNDALCITVAVAGAAWGSTSEKMMPRA